MKKRISIVLSVLCLCALLFALASCGHEHNYKQEWEKNETEHWHACDGEECVEVSDKGAHTWNEGVVQTEATEEAEGSKLFTCSVCGQTKTEKIDKLAHVHNYADATCTAPKTCKKEGCNATDGEALGHDYADATCTVAKTCKRDNCGATDGEALGHDYADATCTEAKTCKRDNCGITDGEPLGHEYYTKDDAVEGTHYRVTVEPTCTENGEMVYLCTVCNKAGGANETKSIDALTHDWEKTMDPYCGNGGMTEYECTRVCRGEACGETNKEPAEGEFRHSYGDEIENATCVTNATYKCSVCEQNFTAYNGDQYGQATNAHVYDIKGESVDSTCYAEGYTVYSCSAGNCGLTSNKDIKPRTAHKFGTSTVQGTVMCSVCNSVYLDVSAEKLAGSGTICFGCGEDECICGDNGIVVEWSGYSAPKAPEAITAGVDFTKDKVVWTETQSLEKPLAIGNGLIVLNSNDGTTEVNFVVKLYASNSDDVVATIEVKGASVQINLYEYEDVSKVVISTDADALVSFYSKVN